MSSEKIRVAYILFTLRLGGAERHVVELATYLNEKRFEPFIVSLTSGGPLQGTVKDQGIQAYILDYKWYISRNRWIRKVEHLGHAYSLRDFGRFLKQKKPDIIHAYLPLPNIYSAFAKCFFVRQPRLIVSKRALGSYKEGRALLRIAENWTNQVADVVFVNSQAVREDILKREKVDPSKIRLVYNGVDVEKFSISINKGRKRQELSLFSDSKIVGMVANLRPCKGHEELIKAARLVVNEVPNTKFLVVGRDDGIMERLENLARELGISEAIIFLGQRQDIPEILQVFDVQVLASHEEGFSNVVLEGMAAGKPMVVTDVGGNPEAVSNGETGLVVPAGNEQALAQAIIRLLKSPAEAHRLGQAAQQRVREHFTIKRMVEKVEALYEELV